MGHTDLGPIRGAPSGEHAASRDVRKIDLTSWPSREAANRLYRRLGFERQTNVYRLTLPTKDAASPFEKAGP